MPSVTLTDALRREYDRLFNTCTIRPERTADIEATVAKLAAARGRPRTGNPPFTWEVSAADALSLRGLGRDTERSLAGTLFQIEGYNGWGVPTATPAAAEPVPVEFLESLHAREIHRR